MGVPVAPYVNMLVGPALLRKKLGRFPVSTEPVELKVAVQPLDCGKFLVEN
jgi:hypothetical protein